VMKESAKFVLGFLVQDPDGKLVTSLLLAGELLPDAWHQKENSSYLWSDH
jgi:hypothetical protein